MAGKYEVICGWGEDHQVGFVSASNANAALIAAAPDLLAACRAAQKIAEAVGAGPLEEQVRAAIAKAEGR